MTTNDTRFRRDFLRQLAALLERYQVDIVGTRVGRVAIHHAGETIFAGSLDSPQSSAAALRQAAAALADTPTSSSSSCTDSISG